MKTGDIVYLCEEEFSKFRMIVDYIATYESSIRTKFNILKNEFSVIADYGDRILVTLESVELDAAFGSKCPSYKMNELYSLLNQDKRYVNKRHGLIDDEVKKISSGTNSIYYYNVSKIELRNYLFLFDKKLITFIK